MYVKNFYLVLPLSLAAFAHASENMATTYKMDEVIVTAARTAQAVDQTLASVSIITREDIEQSQATSVPELLATLPGVQITTNGGPGATTSVFIRGISNKQTLFLIDGQRINSATSGNAPVQFIDPDQIERIELVRGPKASLYGSDAIAGVINIITRSGKGKPRVSLKSGYGSDNTRTGSINLGGGDHKTNYHIGISRFLTDGYDRTTDLQSTDNDDDAYNNTTISAKINHRFTDKLSGDLSAFQTEGTTKYDTSLEQNSRTTFREQVFSANGTYVVNDAWETRLTLAHTVDDSNNYDRPNSHSHYKTSRHLVGWQNDISVTDNTLLTTGAEYYKDRVDSNLNYDEDSRTNKAIYAQTITSFNRSDLQLSVRGDDNERYGNKTTGSIAYGFNLPADMRLIASYGTAFQAPTFNDIQYSDSPLEPEESKNAELELRGKMDNGQWSIALFQNKIDNLITFQKEMDQNKAVSIDEVLIRGVEISGQYAINGYTLTGALTLLDPKEIRHNASDRILELRAHRTLYLGIDKKVGDVTYGADLLAQSKRYDDVYQRGRQVLPGYTTVGLRAAWQVNKNVKLAAKLHNVLNKNYQTVWGYNEPSRGIFASVTWTPEF